MCEQGIVLMTPLCAERVQADATLSAEGATIVEDFVHDTTADGEGGGVVVYTKISSGTTAAAAAAVLVPTDDLQYLPPQLGLFASRHNASTDLVAVDQQINAQFKKQYTALMYHLDLESGAAEWGASQVRNKDLKSHNTFDPTVRPVSTIGNH